MSRVEEDVVGKIYDGRLMARLLSYVKPHLGKLAVALVLALIVTGADLARPYLIKIAIDSHINALGTPMVAYAADQAPKGLPGAVFDGHDFVRVSNLSGHAAPSAARYRILAVGHQEVLVRGGRAVLPAGGTLLQRSHGLYLNFGGHLYAAQVLSHQALQIFRAQDVHALWTLALLFLIVVLLSFVANYAQVYVLQWVGQKVVYTLRQQLFTHLQHIHLGFFDQNPVGRLVTRVTNDTETLNEMYSNVLVNVFKDLFLLVGVVVVMLQLSPRLALWSFTVIPFVIVATVLYRKHARVAYRNARLALARINAFLSENLSGMRVIQLFHRERRQAERFEAVSAEYLQAGLREIRLFAIFRPSMDLLYTLGLALLAWFGGGSVIDHAVQFGVLYAFINYMQQFFQPINDITQKFSTLQSAMASSERLFTLLDRKVEIVDPPQFQEVGRLQGQVEFRHVYFAYQGEEHVLKDVSFKVEPGESIALVGATGAGKSSIISLLSRFYDVSDGQILIDGHDLREMRQADLRRQIGVVLQDVFLFSGDIRSNIGLDDPDISDEMIERAAEAVGADAFIRALPAGYDEPVRERGATLSMGQRQLIAFARALAFDPAILVLDEATANIDTETEILIQRALTEIMRGRTTLVVAHRLSTVQHCDRIIVLHKGRVREMGSHQDLLRQGGLYYDLYRLQYKDDFAGTTAQSAADPA